MSVRAESRTNRIQHRISTPLDVTKQKVTDKNKMKPLKVILSGGGTGGHIFPAVAIANEIKKLVPHAEILFVGALGKMEMEKVPAAGYKIIGVPIAGLQRKFTWANFKLPFLIIKSLLATRKIISDFKPDVVVGTGQSTGRDRVTAHVRCAL